MKLFSKLYDRVLSWSKHPKAQWYLGGMSFAESSFFPIPPDVMLMPMSLARPEKAFFYAWITTIFSLLGGLLGYALGFWLMDVLLPILDSAGYGPKLAQAQTFFDEYGVWVVFIAGFSPVPYKVFTISAGASAMALLPFIIASFIGRGARFFLVAAAMRWGGKRFEDSLRKWVDAIGWGLVGLLLLYFVYKWMV
ncbi:MULTISPECIES: YqaA family protein [Thiomicrorhabdus]|uniref:DedA family protein n=1 Tax=Thiomicrorhabdus heinhorstiae TaxID=2748010 RepID=A0ABS0BSQ7_9GAMM|nr:MULTISPECIES: YqaA family protein [Thiomicrorhabdus]MBF6056845.1 DedA family protein [Thiomicrorhabdus heinhorstiae]